MFTKGFSKIAALSRHRIIQAALSSSRLGGGGSSKAHMVARDLADEYALARATGRSMGKHLKALHGEHPKPRPGLVAAVKKLLGR